MPIRAIFTETVTNNVTQKTGMYVQIVHMPACSYPCIVASSYSLYKLTSYSYINCIIFPSLTAIVVVNFISLATIYVHSFIAIH